MVNAFYIFVRLYLVVEKSISNGVKTNLEHFGQEYDK